MDKRNTDTRIRFHSDLTGAHVDRIVFATASAILQLSYKWNEAPEEVLDKERTKRRSA